MTYNIVFANGSECYGYSIDCTLNDATLELYAAISSFISSELKRCTVKRLVKNIAFADFSIYKNSQPVYTLSSGDIISHGCTIINGQSVPYHSFTFPLKSLTHHTLTEWRSIAHDECIDRHNSTISFCVI